MTSVMIHMLFAVALGTMSAFGQEQAVEISSSSNVQKVVQPHSPQQLMRRSAVDVEGHADPAPAADADAAPAGAADAAATPAAAGPAVNTGNGPSAESDSTTDLILYTGCLRTGAEDPEITPACKNRGGDTSLAECDCFTIIAGKKSPDKFAVCCEHLASDINPMGKPWCNGPDRRPKEFQGDQADKDWASHPLTPGEVTQAASHSAVAGAGADAEAGADVAATPAADADAAATPAAADAAATPAAATPAADADAAATPAAADAAATPAAADDAAAAPAPP